MKQIWGIFNSLCAGGVERERLFLLREFKRIGYDVHVIYCENGEYSNSYNNEFKTYFCSSLEDLHNNINFIATDTICLVDCKIGHLFYNGVTQAVNFLKEKAFANLIEITTNSESLFVNPDKSIYRFIKIDSESLRSFLPPQYMEKCIVVTNFHTIEPSIIILMAARQYKVKQIDKAIEMLGKINDDVFIKLYVMGRDGGERENLKILASKLPKSKIVIFKDHEDDIEYMFRACDIYINSSKIEGVSGAILDALYMKKPVLCSNVGCNGELVNHKKTGFVYNTSEEMLEGFYWIKNNMFEKKTDETVSSPKMAVEKLLRVLNNEEF